jgi:hypothetical protein
MAQGGEGQGSDDNMLKQWRTRLGHLATSFLRKTRKVKRRERKGPMHDEPTGLRSRAGQWGTGARGGVGLVWHEGTRLGGGRRSPMRIGGGLCCGK